MTVIGSTSYLLGGMSGGHPLAAITVVALFCLGRASGMGRVAGSALVLLYAGFAVFQMSA